MKIAFAIRTLEKAGFTLQQHGAFTSARLAGVPAVLTLCRNGGEFSDYVATIKVCRESDLNDIGSDYSSGCFFDTLKSAMSYARSFGGAK